MCGVCGVGDFGCECGVVEVGVEVEEEWVGV